MGKPQHENPERRLDSWKEIASFFARDERTVRRWEKEQALPVHRIPGGAKGRVFAYEDELRRWLDTSRVLTTANCSQEGSLVFPPRSVRKGLPLHFTVNWVIGLVICTIAIAGWFLFRDNWIDARHISIASRAPNSVRRPAANSSAEAEDLYLEGRYYWNKRTPDDLNRAVDYFTQAIVRDPSYAKAYAGLADSYNLLREYSAMPDSEAYPRALAAATKAVELDDNLAEAHVSLAFVTFFWNWDADRAEREFKHALVLNPNDARGHHWYASFLLTSGRITEALIQIETARRLDPTSTTILADKGLMLSLAGQADKAVTLLRQVQDTEPSFVSTHRYLSEIYFDRQNYAGYLSEWEKTALLTHDQREATLVKVAKEGFAKAGSVGMLENTLRMQKHFYEKGLLPAYPVAVTCARLGEKRGTFQYLDKAYKNHENLLLYLASDLAFKKLRDEPEYLTLVAKVGRTVRTAP